MSVNLDASILPANYVQQLCLLLERWGVPASVLLAGTGVTSADLADPLARITPHQNADIIIRARALSGEPALAVWWGQQMRLSWHGSVGFAVLASSTLREALEVGVRYLPLRSPEMAMAYRESGANLEISLQANFLSQITREYSLIAVLIFFGQIAEELMGELPPVRVKLAIQKPVWWDQHRHNLHDRVRFSATSHQILMPARYLDCPLRSGDPSAAQLARTQCEQEMKAMSALLGISGQVRRLILDWHEGLPAQETVAALLGISSRTLARRLLQEKTSYRHLLDDVLCTRACAQLENRATGIEQLAENLGYSDSANFSRAFRRWSGKSPRAWRQANGISG
jgi:AraC-like DNA-binding protein